eukprot:gnl/Chilomastix_cuspidata/2488.p1 GENE.gnl/Chilomastix_cuspidata/2488~~gnl/Chilomastix_cuspidata/2488.p1  ORF type:complete len:820 (-),score=172.85 gnl/Chilomastix_cuspidata/2488:526-2985(-)
MSFFRQAQRFSETQPNILNKIVDRERTISRIIISLALQAKYYYDLNKFPIPSTFGTPGIGKTSLGIHMFGRVSKSPRLYSHILEEARKLDATLPQYIDGILYLACSGRRLFFLSCSDVTSPESFSSAVLDESESHIERSPKMQPLAKEVRRRVCAGPPRQQALEALAVANKRINKFRSHHGHPNPEKINLFNNVNDTDAARRCLDVKPPASLPFLVFLDEVDKLSTEEMTNLLTFLCGLIAKQAILLQVSGNLSPTVTEILRTSKYNLRSIRLGPILHPYHIEKLAKCAGVVCGSRGCPLFAHKDDRKTQGTRYVQLCPGAFSYFMQRAMWTAGVAVILSLFCRKIVELTVQFSATRGFADFQDQPHIHLSVVEKAFTLCVPADIFKCYKPTPLHLALAISSLPMLSSDTIDGVTVGELEERGMIYLTDFKPIEQVAAPAGFSVSVRDAELTPADLIGENERAERPPIPQHLRQLAELSSPRGTSTNKLLFNKNVINHPVPTNCGHFCQQVNEQCVGDTVTPVSVLCPSVLCKELPAFAKELDRLPAWAGSLQTSRLLFRETPGRCCHEEACLLCAARALLTSVLQKSERSLDSCDIPFWRIVVQGVTQTHLVGPGSFDQFSNLIFRAPSRTSTIGALIYKLANSVCVFRAEMSRAQVCPIDVALSTFRDITRRFHFVVNGEATAPPHFFSTGIDSQTDSVFIIAFDVSAADSATNLAAAWAQTQALGFLEGWEIPQYLVSIRANMSTVSSNDFPTQQQYLKKLDEVGIIPKTERLSLANKARTNHILCGASFFGPSWQSFLVADSTMSGKMGVIGAHA